MHGFLKYFHLDGSGRFSTEVSTSNWLPFLSDLIPLSILMIFTNNSQYHIQKYNPNNKQKHLTNI